MQTVRLMNPQQFAEVLEISVSEVRAALRAMGILPEAFRRATAYYDVAAQDQILDFVSRDWKRKIKTKGQR